MAESEPPFPGFQEFPKHIYSKRTGEERIVYSREEEESHMKAPGTGPKLVGEVQGPDVPTGPAK
jgi:hypothetical protein